jgi:hypothetical protein
MRLSIMNKKKEIKMNHISPIRTDKFYHSLRESFMYFGFAKIKTYVFLCDLCGSFLNFK